MPGLLQRAILSASSAVGLLARPWRGLGLPVRVLYGPTPTARSLLGEQETADSLPPVIGALSLLCDATISLPWQIVHRASPESGTDIIDDIAAAETLEAWPLYDRWAWLYNALLAGNGVALLEAGRLETYPCQRVSFRLYEDNSLGMLLVPPAGAPAEEVPASACAHLKYRPVGYDTRIGVSPLIQAAETVELLLRHRRMVAATMRNAARPSGYLKTEGKLDQRKAEQHKERWEATYGGSGAGGTAVLEEGLSYATIPMNDLQELASEATAKLGTGDVARLYGIPAALLLGEEQSRASASEDRRRLMAFSVSPLCRLCEDALSPCLLTPTQRQQGYAVRLDTSVEQLGQGSEMAETISKLINAGAVSVSEARHRLGLAAVDGGEVLRAPANTWPLEAWLDAKPGSGQLPDPSPGTTSSASIALKLITKGWGDARH
jgi:HK97 family phage portal protein